MESSQFTHTQSYFESIEQIESQGATCDTFRVKLYGKLHFLKRLKPEYAGDIRYREALRKEFETGYLLIHCLLQVPRIRNKFNYRIRSIFRTAHASQAITLS